MPYYHLRIIVVAACFIFVHTLQAQREYIVTVNPTTGVPTRIDSIPGVRYLLSGTAYNEGSNQYTFIGTWESGTTYHLYTINTITGSVISKPALAGPAKYICFGYARSTGKLYAIVYEAGQYYLVLANSTSGTYAVISHIPGVQGISTFTIDEARQRIYLPAVDNNPSFTLISIDIVTGNIISQVSTIFIGNIVYDNLSQKIYGVASRPDPLSPGNSISSLCTVNSLTGVVSTISDLPGVTGFHSSAPVFNEREQVYFFSGRDETPGSFLYSVDASTGSIIHKAPISTSGTIEKDNLVFFHFDNLSGKMYGLFWEAKTVVTLPNNNSNCDIAPQIKIYPSPFRQTLIINKENTGCEVKMNFYNSTGQLILKNKLLSNGRNEIELPSLSPGIYYYQLFSGSKVVLTGNVIKQ